LRSIILVIIGGTTMSVVELVEVGGGRVVAEDGGEVADDVADDVDADEVAEAVAGGARAAHERAVQEVDLLDGVVTGGGGGEGQEHLGGADPVADEVGGVAAQDHALAEHAVGEVDELVDEGRVALVRGHDLEQVHVAGRVEEVEADEAGAGGLGQTLGDGADAEAGGVAGEDRVRTGGGGHPGEEGLLDVEALDDRLDHEIAGCAGALEVVLEVAGGDAGRVRRVGVGGGFGLEQLLQRAEGEGVSGRTRSGGGGVPRHHVEEEGADAGIGEVGGDLRPHRASAEHRGRDGVGGTKETHGAAG
jgi:hypothetical protein